MPYRAPGADDERLRWILREIQKSQQTLDESIATAERLPDSNLSKTERLARYRTLKREVDNSFFGLDKSVGTWATRDVPSFYQSGWFVGATQTAGARFDFTLPHREALDILSYDAYDDVATRLQGVRQGFTDTVDLQELYEGLSQQDILEIQKRSRSAVTQSLLTGQADPKKVARSLTHDLWNNNPNLKIIDGGGRAWKMETYTRMLVRTKSANAYNGGTLNKYAEEGVQRVKVFDGVEHDNECAAANGETWSLRYAMNHIIAHPNCRRAFAAVSGAGEVNRDTETQGLVVFDRVELTAASIAAIRYFNRTGEINLSSTLARIAWELVEAGTFPMPLVDEFVTGFAHLGLREVDSWIESYIDPVLYNAGLIQRVPDRAQIRAMNRPEQVLDAVANTIKEANLEAFGTEYHPQVRHITDNLSRMAALLESGVWRVRQNATQHVGGLKWLGPILTDAVDMNRLGQITAETLFRWRDADTGLEEAYRAAEFVLDQFKDVKRLHLQAATAGFEDLTDIYDQLDRIGVVAARLLADEIVLDDAPEAFVQVLKTYAITTDDLGDLTFQKRRLGELLNDVRRSQRQVLNQIEEYEGVSRQRALAMPISAGADYPTNTAGMWDLDEYTQGADALATRIGDAEPLFDTDSLTEFMDFFRYVGNIPDHPLREAVKQNLRLERTPSVTLYTAVMDGNPLKTPEDLLQGFLATLRSIKRHDDGTLWLHPSIKGTGIQPWKLDDPDAGWVAEVFEWLSPTFFYDEADSIRGFLKEIGKPHLIYRRLGAVDATKIDDQIVGNFWSGLVADLNDGLAGSSDSVSFDNLGVWLARNYGEANVNRLSGGVNGDVFTVWDENTGRQLFVKKVRSTVGHTDPSSATLSYAMTNWLSDQLGGVIAVPPTRVISLNDSENIAVMPFISEATPWFQMDAVSEVNYESARRAYMFDLLSMESDNHLGNVLMDDWSDGAQEIMIDREMSFAFYRRGTRYDVDQKDGPMLVMNSILGESWYDESDVVSRVDRPVTLVRLTQAEYQALSNTEVFDPVVKSPWGAVTATTFDLDGHNFPFVLLNSGERPARMAVEAGGELKDMDVAIPAGRVGWHIHNRHQQYLPSISPTDSELAFILRLLDPDQRKGLRQEIADALQEGLKDVSKTGTVWNDIDETYAVHELLDLAENDGIGGAADFAITALLARVSQMVDGGVINLAGTKTSIVNTRGDVYKIGDSIKVRHIETGEPIEGLVFNLSEDTRGNPVVHFVSDIGRRLDDPQPNMVETFSPELYTFGEQIVDDEIALAVRIADETTNNFASPLVHVEVDIEPMKLKRPRLDELGLPIGMEEATVQLEYVGKARDVVRVTDDAGDTVSIPAETFITREGEEIIESVMSEIDPEFRPAKIKVHLNVMRTEDGRPSFGFYDPETDELHVAVAQIFPWGIDQVGDNFVAFKLPEGVPAKTAYNELDWDPFVQLMQHEQGHTYQVRREVQQRAVSVTQVMSDFVAEFPDAGSRRDMNEVIKALGLLPDDFDVTKYIDELDALVQTRVDLIEDITYSNFVQEVQTLFDQAEFPAWAERAFAGVDRGDADAIEEVFADLYSRLSDFGGVSERSARKSVADELGVDIVQINRIFNNAAPKPPTSWDLGSDEFRQWLVSSLKNDQLVPSRRSRSALWRKIDVDVDEVIEGARAGGFTVDVDGTKPSSGISVALAQFEEIIPDATKLSDDELTSISVSFMERNRELVESSSELQYGFWLNEKDNKLYMDVVRLFDDEVDAATFGFQETQKAMYSFDRGRTIGLLDDEPDIAGWMSRHYPDDPLDEYIAKRRRIGAVRTERAGVLEEIRGDDGEFLPIGMDAFTEDKQARIIESLDDYYYLPTPEEFDEIALISDEDLVTEGLSRFTKMKKADVVDYLLEEEITFFNKVKAADVQDVALEKLGISVTGKTKTAKVAEIEIAFLEELKGRTVAQLRESARKLNIDRYSKMNHDELAMAIGIIRVNKDAPKLTREVIKQRLIHVLETFERLELEGVSDEWLTNIHTKQEFTNLRDKYRFYIPWRNELLQVASESGVSAPMVIAGAARMSAGMLAEANLYAARLGARLVAENSGLGHRLTAEEAAAIRAWMGVSLADKDGQAYRYLKEFKKPERADEFVRLAATITEDSYLNAYDSVTGAYIWHVLTLRESLGLGATGKGYSLSTQYGFPQFQVALSGMQGRLSINDVLGDSKVRSFSNNILDPENIAGVGDVTVDFHMTDMGLNGVGKIGKIKGEYKGDEPRIFGVGAGLRPIIGDIVRELYDEGWGARVNADQPLDLQEILWGIWRDGKEWGLWGTLRPVADKPR